MSEQKRNIVPLYAARVEDLADGKTVLVSCECGHKGEILVSVLRERLPGWYRVSELFRVLRCQQCRQRGDVRVDARKALGHSG